MWLRKKEKCMYNMYVYVYVYVCCSLLVVYVAKLVKSNRLLGHTHHSHIPHLSENQPPGPKSLYHRCPTDALTQPRWRLSCILFLAHHTRHTFLVAISHHTHPAALALVLLLAHYTHRTLPVLT